MALTGSCAPREPTRFDVSIKVESDPGEPVPHARLTLRGQPLGQTDARGLSVFRVAGTPGDIVDVQVACPDGYRSPERPVRLVLKRLVEVDRVPEYQVRCPPSLRSLVVAVRAQGASRVPVRYLGKEIARTDEAGACHALLRLPPGESASLTLDTSAPEHQRLIPKNPQLKLTVPERDEVVVFDQTFTREEEPKARARPRRKRTGPVRL